MNKMVFFFYIMIFGDLMKIVIAEKNEKDYLCAISGYVYCCLF